MQLHKGQALVTVIMIMVIALAFGITVSTRFIKSLHTTSESDFSVRALSVAEAAAEHVLLFSESELADFITNNSCGSNCALTIIGGDGIVSTANVTLSHLGNSQNNYTYLGKQSDTVQVELQGYTGNIVSVCWDDNGASLYGMYLYQTAGAYSVEPYAYNSIVPFDSTNGFDSATSQNGFNNCFSVPITGTPIGLRLRPYYADTDITVVPQSGHALPSQGILIESTGLTEDAIRKVDVIRSNSFVPTIFDYVLYQRSDTAPLSN